jgi:hypothetical protein
MINVLGVLAAAVVASTTPPAYVVSMSIAQVGQPTDTPRMTLGRGEEGHFLLQQYGRRLQVFVTPSTLTDGQIKVQVSVEASIPGHVRRASTTVTLGTDHHMAIKLPADGRATEVNFDFNVTAVGA